MESPKESTEGVFRKRSSSLAKNDPTDRELPILKKHDEPQEKEKIAPVPQTPAELELGSPKVEDVPMPQTPATPGPAWNANHPCYPHPNPHVPIDSPLIKTTRVIRIPRNYMIAGDVYPAFSNVYPEILAPWIPEIDFRRLIEGLNEQLAYTFDPTGARSAVDGIMGCITGWIWDDLGLTKSKAGMRRIEKFIDDWNQERVHDAKEEDQDLIYCVQLRRTAFLCLDIVIPDPKVMVVNEAELKRSQSPAHQAGMTPTSRAFEARG